MMYSASFKNEMFQKIRPSAKPKILTYNPGQKIINKLTKLCKIGGIFGGIWKHFLKKFILPVISFGL